MKALAMLAAAALVGLLGVVTAAEEESPGNMKQRQFGPPGPGPWVPMPAFTDEFKGDRLDPKKWHDHNPEWKGRAPALFARHNVAVKGGQLHLTMRAEDLPDRPEGYHTFTSAAVKSVGTVRYGYFEVKCRPMKSHGSSAFWFYRSEPARWTEIDVFEIGAGAPGHERKLHMNVHVFRTPEEPDRPHWSKATIWEAPYDLAADYHVYGFEWDQEKMVWTVDGVERRRTKNTHWHQPLHVNFDSETMPQWFGLPKKEDLPSTFSIEYIRAWRRPGTAPAAAPKGDAKTP